MAAVKDLRAIYNRLRLLLSFGRLLRVDDSGPIQLVLVEGFLGELRDRVPRVGQFGLSSNPPADSQVVVAAINADRSNLVAIGVEDRASRPRDTPAGSTVLYSEGGATKIQLDAAGLAEVLGAIFRVSSDAIELDPSGNLEATPGGTLTLDAGGALSIESASAITITAPTVTINGIDFSTHTHVSATAGSPSSVPS